MASSSTTAETAGYGIKREGTNIMANLRLNLVLLGRTGSGKSASGNTILGREAFKSKTSLTSVSRDVTAETGSICGLPITVHDTPGFSGTESKEELLKYEDVLQKCESGLCAFLLVIKADRFTEEDQETVEKIEELLGEKHFKNTWILFTGGDHLEEENTTMTELIHETEALKDLTQKYQGRFHVINNKTRGERNQVKPLISKIFQNNLKNLPKNPQQSGNIQDIPAVSLSSRRIVLLGKTGVGKSAAGNTILGQKEFRSEGGKRSVTSECSSAHATVSGRKVFVVDTPPFFDTKMNPETFMTETVKCAYLSSPGPHAFLIVFPVNMRITEHEQKIPEITELMFGQEVLKYSIILFTHGDLLREETIEEFIERNGRIRNLVDQCGGRFHVFNNRDENNREQVNDLLQKIDSMIEQNGGGHYSNQMNEDALIIRREERERKQQEGKQRHKDTLSVDLSGFESQPKSEAETLKEKSQSEKKSYFISAFGAAVGAVITSPLTLAASRVVNKVVSRTTARATSKTTDTDRATSRATSKTTDTDRATSRATSETTARASSRATARATSETTDTDRATARATSETTDRATSKTTDGVAAIDRATVRVLVEAVAKTSCAVAGGVAGGIVGGFVGGVVGVIVDGVVDGSVGGSVTGAVAGCVGGAVGGVFAGSVAGSVAVAVAEDFGDFSEGSRAAADTEMRPREEEEEKQEEKMALEGIEMRKKKGVES